MHLIALTLAGLRVPDMDRVRQILRTVAILRPPPPTILDTAQQPSLRSSRYYGFEFAN